MKKSYQVFLMLSVFIVLAMFIQASLAATKTCEVTYDNFGKAFLEKYCTKCHVSTKTTMMTRMGAPAGSDFDKVEAVQQYKDKIVQLVTVKKSMPPVAPKPADDEKAKLKTWLECEYAAK